MQEVKLTQMVETSGCAAKLAPGTLHQVLDSLPVMHSPDLLEGYEGSDDAFVHTLPSADDTVMLQTVDFFPPMVDDPYLFGQVAAANALSDIYAMGGEPKVALNLVCFPSCLDLSVLREILLGGQSKVGEAGAVIAGGHTISDPTPKYGLCVTGFASKKSIWANSGAEVGDLLVLTKPLGVGIINTAVKAGQASEVATKKAIESMTMLNKQARDEASAFTVHAATDITGFSLIGHATEMAVASKVGITLYASKVPLFQEALVYAQMGLNPGGMYKNREYLEQKVSLQDSFAQEMLDVLYDPQTSGGLLLSMKEKDAVAYSRNTGYPIIGSVGPEGNTPISIHQ
ncbi:MAG: selenide, water dikinase [Sphaerochaeta sp.]|jgi:selenide,water dikinase|nr:selenide, water dikinase [Sphaerochaeta sp.]MDN5334775.1 selenide, water dikinase [Sphaerochaeta sp.]